MPLLTTCHPLNRTIVILNLIQDLHLFVVVYSLFKNK